MRNVVSDAKALIQSRSRTYSHAAADTASADPQLQQIIGQLSSSAFAAEAIVLAAADAQDTSVNHVVDGVIDFALDHNASLQAAQAKVIVEDLAFKTSTLLFDVGGASATKQWRISIVTGVTSVLWHLTIQQFIKRVLSVTT